MKTLSNCALALIVAIPVSISTSVQSVEAQTLRSFEAYNRPSNYIRHRNGLGFISPVTTYLDTQDATFAFRPGLNGRTDCTSVSFEAVNYPGNFLRHKDFRIQLNRNDGTQLFKNDATFCLNPSIIGDANARSFESSNFRNHYIRHRDGKLYIDPRRIDSLYERDASFIIRGPLYTPPVPVR